MILIVDSGSTKTSWLVAQNKEIIQKIETSGYNPYYYKYDKLVEIIDNELLPHLVENDIKDIFYYGSGCSSETNNSKVEEAFIRKFPKASIKINHDLTGAAAALLKNKPGIACILGTGSNSCLWDGEKVVENVPSVGYLLGDEGSGTYLGMKILKGILENKAPESIINEFYSYYNMSFESVLSSIYENPDPNRLFSAIPKFAGVKISHPWIKEQIVSSFNDFIENQIKYYPDYNKNSICFTGSIAFHFRNQLVEALSKHGLKTGIILKEPIDGLFEYHCK